MPAAGRAPVVALLTLLQRRFPGLDDPARLIKEGAVLVGGVPAESPRTRVRADAVIQIRQPRPLRGTTKLACALAAFAIDAAGAQTAAGALEEHGWRILGQQPSPILGAKGAVEIFIRAASGLQAQ